jgi:preprotein translocase subunit SecA
MTTVQSSSHISNRPPSWPIHLRYMATHIKDLALLLDNVIDQTRDAAYSSDRLIVIASDIASAINDIADAIIARVLREEEEAQK